MVGIGILAGAVWGSSADPASQRWNLLAGSAWVPSRVGQVTLLAGASARPIASVAVGRSGDDLSVTQTDTAAYVVDQSAGTVNRVDSATFDVSPAYTFAASGGANLQVL